MDVALSSRCTGPFRMFTLTSRRCLAAGRRGTTAAIISRVLVQSGDRRNAENLSETVPASARVCSGFSLNLPGMTTQS